MTTVIALIGRLITVPHASSSKPPSPVCPTLELSGRRPRTRRSYRNADPGGPLGRIVSPASANSHTKCNTAKRPLGRPPVCQEGRTTWESSTKPMATFSAHTASPPPPSRTPARSRASSRYASITPRTTSAHGPLPWDARRTRTHRSNPSSANACGSFTPPTNSPLPDSRLSCSTAFPRSPRTSSAFQSTRSQGSRHNVLLFRVDRPSEGFHPLRPRSRPRRQPPRCLHHFVSHPAERGGHRPGRGSRLRDDASRRPQPLHDDRSTRPMSTYDGIPAEGVALRAPEAG